MVALSKEELKEMSLIELAHHLFEEKREAMAFTDLMEEMAKLLGLTPEESRTRMLQFYTDLNVDGRFLALGENKWGLREWYPFEQVDEEVIVPTKTKKKKAKKVIEEDEYIDEFEDEDLDYDLEEDEFEDDEEEEDESLEVLREEEAEFEDEDLLEDEEEEYEIDEEELDIEEEEDEFEEEEEEE